jgi:hypothetical protein
LAVPRRFEDGGVYLMRASMLAAQDQKAAIHVHGRTLHKSDASVALFKET